QYDIKRILAYSTVSQLGLMMVSLGVGGVAAGMMHLLAHGFFKALLFLGAGSVIHGTHHEQDIRRMGGLRASMRMTFITYAVGMMALSGVPLFFAGAWTKEEILHATAHWPGSRLPHYLMMAGVVLTAFYMTRQMIYVFFGRAAGRASTRPSSSSPNALVSENERTDTQERVRPVGGHESPRVMTLPLVVLAICTIALSVILTPVWPWLHDYLSGTATHVDWSRMIQPMLFVSLVLVLAGVGAGIWIYRGAGARDPLETAQPALFRFLARRMWLDEAYEHTVLLLARTAASVSDWLDRRLWDGVVRGVGTVGQLFGAIARGLDERGLNAGVDEGASATRRGGRWTAAAHSGQVQAYLAAVAMGMVALLLLYAWLR
ncbi:MAG TPA: proton-conducting transporter membrane subunit, partial [Chthoniobacterales bacterium]